MTQPFLQALASDDPGCYLTIVLLLERAMPRTTPPTTTVSTKGQVILPKSIRQSKDWGAGTRLLVEDTSEGVFLRRVPAFVPSRPETVFAMLRWTAEPKSIEDMDAAVLQEARRRDRN